MGFFGHIITEGDALELPIPEDYYLHLRQVCIAPEELEKKKLPSVIFVYAQTANEEQEYVVAVLNPSQNIYSASVNLDFGTEDGPIVLRTSTGSVHVTGQWSWDDEDECGGHDHDMCGEDDDEEEEEEEEESEDEEEPPLLVEMDSESEKPVVKAKSVVAKKVEDVKKVSTEEPNQKKRRVEELTQTTALNVALKKWKVLPDSDDGVPVPDPKTIKKGDGLEITDYIIGTGSVPKGGATVKILYEGLFPDGTVFDQKVKRKSPFSFRKGTGQVISGMDKGMEGMRIGGAREIIVPPHLGYGPRGVGEIPGNQTLIFRIRLVA